MISQFPIRMMAHVDNRRGGQSVFASVQRKQSFGHA